ncbi:MAG: right-handed parallel beta-helix repeat-containing protein [Lentisphaeria bacterium]|nr:right-handed parallel beta-helix repeat-containing protein [Lentisphaeria bacterium]
MPRNGRLLALCRVVSLGLLWTVAVVRAVPAEFWVSPRGDDGAPGTRERPFATLTRARGAVRALRRDGGGVLPGPVTVWLRGGLYEVPETLSLTPEDGGSPACPVNYAAATGETPILSGGRLVRDWTPAGDGSWRAHLAGVAAGGWVFHQLFVRQPEQAGFERRYRPSRGLFVIAGLTDAPHRDPQARIDHRNPQREVFFRPGDIERWDNLEDVELVFLHDWSSGRMHIADIDWTEYIVRFTEFPHYRIGHWYPGGRNPYLVENLREAFGRPGEWYLDRPSGGLRYMPLPEEDPSRMEFVAPFLERLVTLTGDLAEERFVEHVTFRGLTFAHTAWRHPPHLYAEALGRACRQGFVDMPAAVELEAARQCRFERCVFAGLGSYALDLGEGCHDNLVQGNRMVDLGTGGIKVGTVDRTAAPPRLPTGNAIENNLVSDAGVVHYSGHGIWGGMCARTRIRHNVVTRTLYSAVAVGWSHGKEETACRENRIEANHVYDVMLLLDHGGAIYTLGNQPGTVIRANLVHDTYQTKLHGDIRRPDWTAGGLAFDDGSSGFLVERNVIYDTPCPPARALTEGRATEMTVRDNICGIRPGEPGFPEAIAAAAGLQPPYRDLLGVPFRAVPPPILAMTLPMHLRPGPIVDTFDRLPPGSRPTRAFCRLEDKEPGKGTDAIAITDQTAAEGPNSLRILDAPGLSREWIPYVSYTPAYTDGRASVAFGLRPEKGTRLEVVWRGKHPQREFAVGPQFWVRDGAVWLGERALHEVPEGQWCRFEMTARLGAPDPGIGEAGLAEYGHWRLTVALPGQPVRVFEALPFVDPSFHDLGTVMFISLATERTVCYLDSVRIVCE